nr:hypothetical protein [Stenomitos rutilans HA7619-LM2]
MAKQKTSEPLTGTALLQKVKTLATLSKTQKAKACGYYTVTKSGGERVNLLQFLHALVEAEGIALDQPAAEGGRAGRRASYRIAVQANGQLLIGAAYRTHLRSQGEAASRFSISLTKQRLILVVALSKVRSKFLTRIL